MRPETVEVSGAPKEQEVVVSSVASKLSGEGVPTLPGLDDDYAAEDAPGPDLTAQARAQPPAADAGRRGIGQWASELCNPPHTAR